MPLPVIRHPSGAIDGFNTIFYTPTAYLSGSLRVWRNGVLLRADLVDGWVELGAGKFQMKEPPKAGDTLTVYYVPN